MKKTKKILINHQNYSHDLVISSKDIDLLEANEKFLKHLIANHTKFVDKIKDFEKNFEQIKKNEIYNKNIFFIPEIISHRSPITILNGSWGSGKTYFIEKFATNFTLGKLKEINSNYFSNIIIINALKFINSENAINELMLEVLNILYKICTRQRITQNAKRLLKNLFNSIVVSGVNNRFKTNFQKMQTEIDINIQFKRVSEKLPRTIFFLDNIERLGNESWTILRFLLKLTQFSNLILILPMNMQMMKVNDSKMNSEEQISKYIDLEYFNLKQDYLPFLQKYGFSNRINWLINNILKQEINNSTLSLREVDKRFLQNNIVVWKNNETILINKIFEKVWNSSKNLKIWLEKKVLEYYKMLETGYQSWDAVVNLMQEFEKNFLEILNKSLTTDTWNKICKFIEYDYELQQMFSQNIFMDIEKLIKEIQELNDYDKNAIKNLENRILYFKKSTDKSKNIIEKLSCTIEKEKYTLQFSEEKINQIQKTEKEKEHKQFEKNDLERQVESLKKELLQLKESNPETLIRVKKVQDWIKRTTKINIKTKNLFAKIFTKIDKEIINASFLIYWNEIKDSNDFKDRILKQIINF